jgi:hypothetical protein
MRLDRITPKQHKNTLRKPLAIEPIENSLADLYNKVDILLPKSKIDREILPFRDPLNLSFFPLFFTNSGSQGNSSKRFKTSSIKDSLYLALSYRNSS